jgi:hypothetical protein
MFQDFSSFLAESQASYILNEKKTLAFRYADDERVSLINVPVLERHVPAYRRKKRRIHYRWGK